MRPVCGTYFARSNGPLAIPSGNRGSWTAGVFVLSIGRGRAVYAAPARSVCRAAGPAPSIPFAPGKKPYSESKLRFSWKITTTCSIRSIPGVGEGAAAGLVHAAATSSVVPSAEM